MTLKNYYIVLGVKSTATTDEIKTAFRELAKKYHPDKNPGDKFAEERFKEIQEAYMVLSNPEKKRNYDLKLNYTNRTQKTYNQQPFTGNAYSYAQQQYAARNNAAFNNLKSRPRNTHKPEERYQVVASVGVAMILLYFIISYSSSQEQNKKIKSSQPLTEKEIEALLKTELEKTSKKVDDVMIHNFDSPYTKYFGEEVYQDASKNNIVISAPGNSEAVVCLVENKSPFKVIRNQYMSAGSVFKMNNIPNGDYFLKVFYGNNWDTTVTFLNHSFKGGFKDQIGFVKIMNGKKGFKMSHIPEGNSASFSSYEITLNPNSDLEKRQAISEKEFFN